MIVQCEQCSTKFRLDDAKVPESGVKVRCAKCRHIFVVQREPARDEPDMDSFLQGLGGAGITATPEVPAPSAPGPSVEVDPDLMRTLAAAQEQEDAADEFSFDVTPSPVSAPTEDKEDFQEFEFDISAPSSAVAPDGASPSETPTFQEFSFDLPGMSPEEPATATPAVETPAPLTIGVDADEFSFDVSPPAASEVSKFSTDLLPDLPADESDGFTFGEQPMAASPPQAAAGSVFGTTPAVELPSAVTGETFGFGELPGSTLEAGPAASWDRPESSTTFEAPSQESLVADAGQFTFSPPPASPAEQAPDTDADLRAMILRGEGREQKRADFASDSFVFDTGDQAGADGAELPPLTISSRKVGGGGLFAKMILLVILLLLAAGGGGWWYVQQNGIAGLEGVLAAVGVDMTPRFELRSVSAGYLKNAEGLDLFVVRGEVRNLSRFGRGEIKVRAMIYGPGGKPLSRKEAYAGNPLPDSRLVTLPFADVEKAMSNRFGDTLDNMEVKRDEVIPFAVVFSTPPAEAVDYGVEVAGSVLAANKQ